MKRSKRLKCLFFAKIVTDVTSAKCKAGKGAAAIMEKIPPPLFLSNEEL